MTRVCIIDDEFRARQRIADLLKRRSELLVVGEADNGGDAVELIDRVHPDLVILDIKMPGLSGFQVLQQSSHRPEVIFVTAYDEHAVQAFEVHAVDYLLKPFPDERFFEAIDRVTLSSDTERSVSPALLDSLRKMIQAAETRPSTIYMERIPIRRNFEFEMVPVTEIDYFTISGGLVFLVRDERRSVVDHTLTELEERLNPGLFMRIHRKSLININRIERVVPWGRGRLALHFQNGDAIHVGRDRTQAVRERLGI